jgi:hypothetical protein
MKKLLILFLFISASAFAQEKYKLLTKIEADADIFTTDNQCNIYVVKNNELVKYDKNGKQLYKYSNKNLGKISSVDASNMLRILVYYRDFLTVVFLDNTLAESSTPLNLQTLEAASLTQVSLVCASANKNRLWLFDQSNFSLEQYSEEFDRYDVTALGNLNKLLNDSLQPVSMIEYNNKLYMNNPKSGIIIFDNYGTYYKTLPLKNLKYFQPIGDWVYYADGKKIRASNIKTAEEKEFTAPADFKGFRLENDILLLQDEHSVTLYTAP